MTEQTLAEALTLTDDGEGGLTARLTSGFSNAPQSAPQERGAPFGGLMAALAAGAMRQGLGIETGIDLDKLVDAGAFISGVLGRQPQSRAATAILNKRAA